MKISVTNVALLNTGDAAIMEGTATIFRQVFGDEIQFVLYDQQPDDAKRAYPEYRVLPTLHGAAEGDERYDGVFGKVKILVGASLWRTPFRRLAAGLMSPPLLETLTSYAESDLIVSAGGTYLVPHYRIRPKLLELLVARLLGRPYCLMTQSLGPFPNDRPLLRLALNGASAIFVRDKQSLKHLAELGLTHDRVHHCADAAFALRGNAGRTHHARAELSVGISVRNWPHGDDGEPERAMSRYKKAIADLVTHLVQKHGARICFISTCQGNPAYWTDDSAVAEEIANKLPEQISQRVSVDRRAHRSGELTARLSEFDLFVGTRMHGTILALLAGVPVLPIAYEFKTTELFSALGMDAFVQLLSEIEGPAICAAADQLLHERLRYINILRDAVGDLRTSALSAGPMLHSALATHG